MIKTLLTLSLLSPAAHALEVGDLVPVSRAHIACHDENLPAPECHPHFYIDCLERYPRGEARINVPVEGFTNLAAAFTGSCSLLPPGETLNLEVLETRTAKVPGTGIVEEIKLGIGHFVFDGSRVKR